MSKKNYYKRKETFPIFSVYDELCQRDPDWRHVKMLPRFKTLYDGWRTTELRHKLHTGAFYTLHWRSKTLGNPEFERFRAYVLQ